MTKINVKGTEISILNIENEDYISITDMLKAKFNCGEYAIIKSNR